MATITASELTYSLSSAPKLNTVGFFDVFKSSFVKDIQIQMRYKQNFVGQFIRTLLFILIFYLFSLSFAFSDLPDQSIGTVFLFYIAALSMMMFDGVALWSPYQSVRRDLYNGALEAIYQTPGSRFAYYFGGIAASAIYSFVFVIPLFLVMILVVQPTGFVIGMMALSLGAALGTLMGMGLIVGMTAILWKNTGALINILGMMFQFVTGTIIPFASLPFFAQVIGYLFPITWGLDLVRYYLFGPVWVTIYPVPVMWAILLGQTILFFGTAKFLMGRVEKHSKKNGLHLI